MTQPFKYVDRNGACAFCKRTREEVGRCPMDLTFVTGPICQSIFRLMCEHRDVGITGAQMVEQIFSHSPDAPNNPANSIQAIISRIRPKLREHGFEIVLSKSRPARYHIVDHGEPSAAEAPKGRSRRTLTIASNNDNPLPSPISDRMILDIGDGLSRIEGRSFQDEIIEFMGRVLATLDDDQHPTGITIAITTSAPGGGRNDFRIGFKVSDDFREAVEMIGCLDLLKDDVRKCYNGCD